jgi:hypothetical protein
MAFNTDPIDEDEMKLVPHILENESSYINM